MPTHSGRRALAVAGLVVVLSFLSACGDGDEEQPATTTTSAGSPATTAPSRPATTQPAERSVSIEVRDGAVVGGPVRLEARLGEQLRIVVNSDVADEVHIHGYDRLAPVAAGGQAAIVLKADLPGVFEMELERRNLSLGELVVKP